MRVINQFPEIIRGQRVIVRCNFDVPITDGEVSDTTRIEDALATITFLLAHSATVTLIAHAGRPDGQYHPEYSLAPVAKSLETLLQPVNFIPYHQMFTDQPSDLEVTLLDNLRFFPGEEAKDPDFAHKLGRYATVYVNESFATSHRDHASITLLPEQMAGYAGIAFDKEVEALNRILKNPRRPLVVVLGGAKLETKEPLIDAFKSHADHILIGGKLALDLAGRSGLAANVHCAGLLPSGKDITSKSAESFARYIKTAGTVIWNGTMGVFEEPKHRQGTRIVAEAINQTQAFTLVGGGDTETALTVLDQEANISHISSGGGAMLTFLTTHTLVGLEALKS
jgi:phosphoglycerate kinase